MRPTGKATPSTSDQPEDVEGAVMEAAMMAEIVSQWMATSLGFEKREPPRLDEDDCSRIYWAITTLAAMTREADEMLHRSGNPVVAEASDAK